MFTAIEGSSADELWRAAAQLFEDGDFPSQFGRGGHTKEILHAALCLHNPRDRWVISRSPAINPAFALVEVIWILKGRKDSAFLNYFNSQLPQFAGIGASYHGAYGFRLRTSAGIDQLARAYHVLTNNPASRQVVLQIWDTRLDLPDTDGRPVAEDIPCNISSILKIRDGKLEWTQIMRSNDLFRGLPYNLVQFTSLQEIIAGWLQVEVGSYHHYSDSLHLYEGSGTPTKGHNKIDYLANGDDLRSTFEQTELITNKIENVVNLVIDPSCTASDLAAAFIDLEIPQAWKNLTSVIVSEGLRRRGAEELMEEIIDSGTNPLFKLLFGNWLSRTRSAIR